MINVHMIKQMEDSKKQIKKEIYTKIYEQFNRKIVTSVQCNQKQTLLQVPNFLLGYPTYDVGQAAIYLKRQLEHSGFTVEYLSTSSFHVSWPTKKSETVELPSYQPSPHAKITQSYIEEQDFPSLVNLKKVANKYRQSA
jgi:hypothetical protein